ncbi:hypothetical protein ADK35_37460 [Streptomyces viridochromogenes]|nr:hypothetical protein ADK35_37460 [Streptomyces viridochromogenes]KOG12294.1 hypothetical protein ADK36_35555 [Streptomyces viridochromogenes]
MRAAACSSRQRSFFGSAEANSPSSSRAWAQASRSTAVRDSSSQAALIWKWREGKRPKPVVLPQRMRSSTRACALWRTSRCCREPGAFVVRGQLGAGVRALAPDDDPGAVRVLR